MTDLTQYEYHDNNEIENQNMQFNSIKNHFSFSIVMFQLYRPEVNPLTNYAILIIFTMLLAYWGNQYPTCMNARPHTHKRANTSGAIV